VRASARRAVKDRWSETLKTGASERFGVAVPCFLTAVTRSGADGALGQESPGRQVTAFQASGNRQQVSDGIRRACSIGPTDPGAAASLVPVPWPLIPEKEVHLSLNLQQKEAVVAEVAKQIAGAQAIVLAENRGMPVAQMTQLRAKARASGVYFRVVKNTLVRRAVAETPFAGLSDKMVGPLAYGIGTDPVAVAKVLSDFAKGNDKFVITAGAMPGQVMSAKDVTALASLPSREELLAKLMGTMQAPVAKFVRTLNEVPGRFVRTVAAVRDARQAA